MKGIRDWSNWMRDSNVLNLSIKEICMPGSHNSFSYNTNTKIKAAEPFNSFPILFNGFVKDWSETQYLPIQDQLKQGIRYIDLRIQKYKNDIYTVHGLYCDLLVVFLTQINEFIHSHENEVIIIDINHTYDMNKEDYEGLAEVLDCLFDGNSVECDVHNLNKPLIDLVNENKRVFIFYDCPNEVTLPNHLWNQNFIHSYWPNRPTFQQVADRIISHGKKWIDDRRDGITIFQIILTPTQESIKSCYLSIHQPKTLRLLNDSVRNDFLTFLESEQIKTFHINVLLLDFVQINDPFVEFCIERSISIANNKRNQSFS